MPEIQWTLESLNKAYQQGYMTGLAGKSDSECPYDNYVLVAAWEAGKDDGLFQYQRSIKERKQVRFA